ncbi:WXG100 family type VII secretion target [Streptomyces sp. NPDC018693]|uniref:WXG100 family type VII secretion target n=1 Tax=unclassified Streptomyces TaxID=2593676 RepID=UPI0037B1AFEC
MGVNNNGVTSVSYHGLDVLATRLADEAKQLEDGLAAMKAKVDGIAGQWEGQAHETFTIQQKAWDTEAQGIHDALVAIARVVQSAGGDYLGGDKKAASYYL